MLKVKNRASSTLSANILAPDTTLTVADGSKFPDSNFHITIDDEILLCVSRSGNTMTVERGKEGTTPAGHSAGASVDLRITAGIIEEIQSQLHIEQKDTNVSPFQVSVLHNQYRRAITINNSIATNLVNYQIPVVIDTASLIPTGKMRSDGGDIRFYDTDGITELSYWIEGLMDTATTKIWVKIPSIPASGTKTIYIHYGNLNLTTTSSATATFIREINGVVGSWHFDEGSGTTTVDTSGNNNTGTISGATWTTAGKFVNALSFDGVDDYVDAGNNTSLHLTQFTISAWVNPSSFVAFEPVIKGMSFGLERKFVSPNGMSLWIWNGTTYIETNAPGDIPLNTWTHLVGTYDGSNARVFVNGILQGVPVATSIVLNDLYYVSTYIGRNNTSEEPGRYWNGLIDEVQIYNQALTSAEISDLYNNYGYTTTNYPGKTLVRQYISPEPTVSVGVEEVLPQQVYVNTIYTQTQTGYVGFKANDPTALVDINSNVIRLRVSKTLPTATAPGNVGEIAWDNGYLYVCVAPNTWKRVGLATW